MIDVSIKPGAGHLDQLVEQCGRIDGGEGYGWCDDSIWFVQSWVYAYTGRDQAAADARTHVIERPSSGYQSIINVRLHEAISLACHGDHRGGLRRAVEVVAEIAPAFRNQMILQTARRVLEEVPLDQRDQPAVRDFNAVVGAGKA